MKHQIVQDIREKGPGPLYLFYGDEFLVKDLVQAVVAEVLEEDSRSTNLVVLDGSTLSMAELSAELMTPSFFGDRKVVVVDQTTLFTGRKDQGKAVSRALDSWKSGDRKAALKAFGQLIAITGLEPDTRTGSNDWIKDLLGDSPDPDEAGALVRLAEAFQAEGAPPKGPPDERQVTDLILSEFPEGTVLILTAPGVDERKKLFKALKKHGRTVSCTAVEEKYGTGLDRSFFGDYVGEALQAAGKTIAPGAVDEMFKRSGKEIRRVSAELGKLVAFVGDRPRITQEDVRAVFADFHQGAFFELTNKIRSGDLAECLIALHEHHKAGWHPLQTLGLIATEVRRLILAREMLYTVFRGIWKPGMTYRSFVPAAAQVRASHPELTGKDKLNLLSLNDYPLYLYLKDAQRFPMDKLAAIMEHVLETDTLLKSSRIATASPESLLERLLFKMCG